MVYPIFSSGISPRIDPFLSLLSLFRIWSLLSFFLLFFPFLVGVLGWPPSLVYRSHLGFLAERVGIGLGVGS